MNKYCAYCGTHIDENSRFCSNCGKPLYRTQGLNDAYIPQVTQKTIYTKPKSNGLGIASMVLGIIAFVNSLVCFLYLSAMFVYAGYESSYAVVIAAVTLAISLLSFVFGSISALEGKNSEQGTAGLILSSISLVVCLSTIVVALIDVI